MPIEIKELIIRATVDDKGPSAADDAPQGGGMDADELIKTCVEQVLKIIEREKER